jgi:hypothetical protein
MDPSSIALVVFSSALVVASLGTIIVVGCRKCCIKPEPVVHDWGVTENVSV